MRLLPNSTRLASFAGIIFICSMAILASGCGRKLFPQPGGEAAVPQVRDLQAQVTARGVELAWTIPEGATDKFGYTVTKSEMQWENRNCPECPGVAQHDMQTIDRATVAKALSSPDRKLNWFDSNIAPFHAYRYQVALHDPKDHPLTLSNYAVAKVYPAPAAPADVTIATQPQGILVQWKPVARDVQGQNLHGDLSFRVERMAPNKSWERASPTQLKGNSFLDQSVAAQQNYSYRVVPVLAVDNATILGEPSSPMLVKAPEALPPPPPKSVWAIPAKGALEVRWTESDGAISGYHVYRRQGKEIVRLTASPIQHPPFFDKNVKSNAAYSYAISAVSAQSDHKEGLLSKWAEIRALLIE